MSKRSDHAAKRFLNLVLPHEQWDFTGHKAKPLIRAAFILYEKEWRPYDVRHWKWPFDELRRDAQFTSDEPWTILLHRAMELVNDNPA